MRRVVTVSMTNGLVKTNYVSQHTSLFYSTSMMSGNKLLFRSRCLSSRLQGSSQTTSTDSDMKMIISKVLYPLSLLKDGNWEQHWKQIKTGMITITSASATALRWTWKKMKICLHWLLKHIVPLLILLCCNLQELLSWLVQPLKCLHSKLQK